MIFNLAQICNQHLIACLVVPPLLWALRDHCSKLSAISRITLGLNTTMEVRKSYLEGLHRDLVYWIAQLYRFSGRDRKGPLQVSHTSRVFANRLDAAAIAMVEDTSAEGDLSLGAASRFKRMRLEILGRIDT